MTTFEENESRRLDLAEREINLREREVEAKLKESVAMTDAVLRDVENREKQMAAQEDARERDEEHRAEWRAHRDTVETFNTHHGAILDRIATALETMAQHGATHLVRPAESITPVRRPSAEAKLRDLLLNLVRRDYLDPDAAAYVVTNACTEAGHPAKVDKPLEMKSEWQRGCVCGRQPYA